MSARDVIARYDGNLADGYGHIDAILSALTAAGYRIVPPGGLDAASVEYVARIFSDRAEDIKRILGTEADEYSETWRVLENQSKLIRGMCWWRGGEDRAAALRSLIEEPTNDAR